MTGRQVPLGELAADLRSGERDVTDHVAELYERIDALESDVRAWVGGPKPREWVEAEAAALAERYPEPEHRPPLYGVPVGVKDIFHVDGLPTRAGSALLPGELAGRQAAVVTSLRDAGALVLGKTVTTEFAHFEPGPTRNPHDPAHTPGGSSSGSAAAVAAGTCPLAIGTQTIGSIVRPATFCGVVGYKPSHGRIPLDGVIPLAASVDHVGLFTQDVAGMELAASVCVDDWEPSTGDERPVLGVPEGEYLAQASETGIDRFEGHVDALERAGFEIRRTVAFDDIGAVNDRHDGLVAAEAAMAHHEWFDEYPDRYADSTAGLIREGRTVSVETLADARRGRVRLRTSLAETMSERGIDAWLTPGAPGPAPAGIDSTGDPVMNLPWTHAGLPAVAIPAGAVDGLPVGVQCVAGFGADERLLAWAGPIANALADAA
ncbi:amidase [Halomarina pelagica]|uniref:amidase n=1 Tax=Halomarina pelagica TaxID=2961599 RepID=UPI0020C36921|nr:amidase [Halomarina sp. BND7]